MKKTIFLVALSVTIFSSCKKDEVNIADGMSSNASAASTLTGQGIMFDVDVQANYVITEDVTYSFDRDAAKGYFLTTITGPNITSGQGSQPETPQAPPSREITNGFVEQQKCTFFNGGQLDGSSYTQKVKAGKNNSWTYTWTYTVTGKNVDPLTAWKGEVTQPGVDPVVPINAKIAGLSAMSSNKIPLKYSFSLDNGDGTNRVSDLKVIVDGLEIAQPTATLVTGNDFTYSSNAGLFGNNPELLKGTDGNLATWILSSNSGDTFPGNDGVANAVYAQASTVNVTLGLGTHTVTYTGIVKGNNGVADVPISVTKTIKISGGCN